MAWWWRERGSPPRRASKDRRLGFDAVEGRVLLSALPGRRAAALHAAAVQKAHPGATHSGGVRADKRASAGPAAEPVTVGRQLAFAAKTYADGRSMAASPAVRKVGVAYAKAAVSRDVRKVGLAYARAVIRGNGKTLNELGDTRVVKKVGDTFTRLGKSPFVKSVGDAFASFGRSVADKFNQLFLGEPSPAPRKKLK